MPLQSAVIETGATISKTGGSAKTFAPDGMTIPNGLHIVVPATSDFRVREHATLKYQAPVLDSSGGYSRGVRRISFTIPRLLASGKYVNDVFTIESKIHPETSTANELDHRKMAAQMMFDSDFDAFWATGSLA